MAYARYSKELIPLVDTFGKHPSSHAGGGKRRRKAKIEICSRFQSDPLINAWRFHWRLIGGNGLIICSSETFPTRSNAKRAAKRAKQLMIEAVIDE